MWLPFLVYQKPAIFLINLIPISTQSADFESTPATTDVSQADVCLHALH